MKIVNQEKLATHMSFHRVFIIFMISTDRVLVNLTFFFAYTRAKYSKEQ